MKAVIKAMRLQYDREMKPELVFSLVGNIQDKPELNELSAWLDSGKQLQMELTKPRKNRSLNSNAYLWVMLGKLAEVLGTSKDELYIQMLERYGKFEHIIIKQEALSTFMNMFRSVRVLGKTMLGKHVAVQLQCYIGSSKYDSKEMSILIDGVVSECKEVGIETLPQQEIDAMNSRWQPMGDD